MEFGEKLKKAREEKGMTQQTLADKLYVTRQAVSRWERGERYPDLMTTKCISNILGVTIDSLVSDDEMREFAEKQSLISSQRDGKIMTALYSVVAILSIAVFIPKIIFGIGILSVICEGGDFTISMMPGLIFLVQYIIIAFFSGSCAVASLRKTIDAKFAGIMGIVYCISHFINQFAIVLISYNNNIKMSIIIWFLSFVFYLVFVYVIYQFFIGRHIKWAVFIYALCSYVIIRCIVPTVYQYYMLIYYKEWEVFQITLFEGAVRYFADIVIMVTIILQTVILEKSRKRQLLLEK